MWYTVLPGLPRKKFLFRVINGSTIDRAADGFWDQRSICWGYEGRYGKPLPRRTVYRYYPCSYATKRSGGWLSIALRVSLFSAAYRVPGRDRSGRWYGTERTGNQNRSRLLRWPR